MEALKLNEYGFKDYEEISKNDRCELIFGEIYMMASPSYEHQAIVGNLYYMIKSKIRDKKSKCKAVIAPFDVKLKKNQSENVVQPDVAIYCNDNMKKEVNNIPNVVFEVLSPSTAMKDKSEKLKLYEIFGIEEYFLVSPEYKTVEVFRLKNGKYEYDQAFCLGMKFEVKAIEDEFDVDDVFEDI